MYDWPKGYYEQPKGREHSKHIQIVALACGEGLTRGLAETLGLFMGFPYPYPAGTGSHGFGSGYDLGDPWVTRVRPYVSLGGASCLHQLPYAIDHPERYTALLLLIVSRCGGQCTVMHFESSGTYHPTTPNTQFLPSCPLYYV